MTWQPPSIGSRPVVVLGGGVLGRRIASVFVSGGYNVHIYDLSPETLRAAEDYLEEQRAVYAALVPASSRPAQPGTHSTFDDLSSAVKNAWLVVEAIPEKLELKIDVYGKLDTLCPKDCIFGSNSSSFRSSLMADKIADERRRLLCNIHFTMPPDVLTVELMTSGTTHAEVFPLLTKALEGCGMLVVTAVKESTGFIFNRLWAAVKREILQILAEGVSGPDQIDLLWKTMFKAEIAPCQLMDRIGLDTVAFIEDNYIQERGLDGSMTVDWLRQKYISKGRLGQKSGKGGLYPPASQNETETTPTTNGHASTKGIYVLDVGIGENLQSFNDVATNGKILRVDLFTHRAETIVRNQPLPDGIDISHDAGRIFWTNMGQSTSTRDGSVMSSNVDGSDVQVVIPPGKVHTPKQLAIAHKSQKLYLSDREGTSVHRVDFDGKNHEVLIRHRDEGSAGPDMTQWCVGIAVDEAEGKMYWTQKGPSKAGKGRIFRANLDIPGGETAGKRSDVELLFDNLPEPIDLEIDSENQTLYWTDRGEHPVGSSLNRIRLAAFTGAGKVTPEIVARHFSEPIGLKIDMTSRKVYVTDLGGSVYEVDVDTGKKVAIHRDNACYTGIALA